jgi:Cu/Zn superoxide dismutase
MRRITPIPRAEGTASVLLLLAVLIFALGGCGGGDISSASKEGTTTAKAGGGRTVPAEMVAATVLFTPSQDSGVNGLATLTETENGVEVTLSIQNLPDQPGTEHLAHIHEGGTCADDRAGNSAPVRYPLGSITTGRGGIGSSTTVIPDLTVTQLFSNAPKYINVHAEKTDDEVPPGISCADLSTTTGGD